MTSDTAATHFKAGFDRFVRGDLEGAIAALDRALVLDAGHLEALRTLAMTWFKKGDAAQAVAVAKRLVELAPDDALAWSSLSLFLSRCGHIKEAEDAAAKSKLVTWKRELRELNEKPADAPTPGLNVLTKPGAPPTQGPILPTLARRPPETPQP